MLSADKYVKGSLEGAGTGHSSIYIPLNETLNKNGDASTHDGEIDDFEKLNIRRKEPHPAF